MLDHMGLDVRSAEKSRRFYRLALAPLGYALVEESSGGMAFGPPAQPLFWLRESAVPTTPIHLAFIAPDRAAVDAFHAAALSAGASDNGAPGLRESYHPNYYGAFVIDPDGHNVEAVCHTPE